MKEDNFICRFTGQAIKITLYSGDNKGTIVSINYNGRNPRYVLCHDEDSGRGQYDWHLQQYLKAEHPYTAHR